jgi:Sigma-70, region 4
MELERQVFELAIEQDLSYREIGKKLEISHEYARQILLKAEKRQQAELDRRGIAVKASMYAHLERIRREAHKEFLRSCEPRQRVTTDETGKEVMVAVTGTGNMQCPAIEMKAMAQEAEILGLNIEPAWNDGPYSLADVARNMEERGRLHDERTIKEAAGHPQPGEEPSGLPGGIPGDSEDDAARGKS